MGVDPISIGMMALGGLSQGISGLFGNNASSRYTQPQQMVQSQVGTNISSDLKNPMSNPALSGAIQPVNDSYNNLADSMSQAFQARGFGRSGALPLNLQKLQFAKAGAQGSTASNLYDQMMQLGSSFGTAAPSSSPVSPAAGAISGGASGLFSGAGIASLLKPSSSVPDQVPYNF